jgi:hypothetical protein
MFLLGSLLLDPVAGPHSEFLLSIQSGSDIQRIYDRCHLPSGRICSSCGRSSCVMRGASQDWRNIAAPIAYCHVVRSVILSVSMLAQKPGLAAALPHAPSNPSAPPACAEHSQLTMVSRVPQAPIVAIAWLLYRYPRNIYRSLPSRLTPHASRRSIYIRTFGARIGTLARLSPRVSVRRTCDKLCHVL